MFGRTPCNGKLKGQFFACTRFVDAFAVRQMPSQKRGHRNRKKAGAHPYGGQIPWPPTCTHRACASAHKHRVFLALERIIIPLCHIFRKNHFMFSHFRGLLTYNELLKCWNLIFSHKDKIFDVQTKSILKHISLVEF